MSTYPVAETLMAKAIRLPARARPILSGLLLAVLAMIAVGNAAITGFHLWAKNTTTLGAAATPTDAHNFFVVDDKLMRGSRPTEATYRDLAAAGVTTVVDLRAEEGLVRPMNLLDRLGIKLVQIPMRDGQAPTDKQVNRFITAVRNSPGKVYVHCMAGVGRTGTMVAAYLVSDKETKPLDAVRMNLAVGPPSLEQIAFAMESGNPVITGVSRVLDAPRRLWTYVN